MSTNSPNISSKKQIDHRHTSNNDTQEDLKSFSTILDQYYQHYQQILNDNKHMLQDNGSVWDFLTKMKNKSETEISTVFQAMKQMRKMLEQIFIKLINLLPELSREITDLKSTVSGLHQKVQDRQIVVQQLKEVNQAAQKHLQEISIINQKIKLQNSELNEKLSQKEHQFQTQSREIRRTFMEVSESNQQQKKIMEDLYESYQKITANFNILTQEKKFLELELEKSAKQTLKLRSKIEGMEFEMNKREDRINQYKNQLQSLQDSVRKPRRGSMGSGHSSEPEQSYVNVRQSSSFHETGDEPTNKMDKTKLNEQLQNYQIPNVKDLNGSFIMGSRIKRGVDYDNECISESQEYTKNVKGSILTNQGVDESFLQPEIAITVFKKKDIDPYFSHYILTSQSVKIKEDCEQMLNIDMKPYYEQIVDKRIPMHMWDQWIKNRLRDLLKQL